MKPTLQLKELPGKRTMKWYGKRWMRISREQLTSDYKKMGLTTVQIKRALLAYR